MSPEEIVARAIFKQSVYHGYTDETLRAEWLRMEGILRRQARAALQALMEAGFAVVPVEPAKEMVEAGTVAIENAFDIAQWSDHEGNQYQEDFISAGASFDCYAAMLATAPSTLP